ncbi:NRPS8, partial [Symbiodinium natans]
MYEFTSQLAFELGSSSACAGVSMREHRTPACNSLYTVHPENRTFTMLSGKISMSSPSKNSLSTPGSCPWSPRNLFSSAAEVMQGRMSSSDRVGTKGRRSNWLTRVLQFTSAYWGAAAFGQTRDGKVLPLIDIALAFGASVVFVPTEPGAKGLAAAVENYRISVLGTASRTLATLVRLAVRKSLATPPTFRSKDLAYGVVLHSNLAVAMRFLPCSGQRILEAVNHVHGQSLELLSAGLCSALSACDSHVGRGVHGVVDCEMRFGSTLLRVWAAATIKFAPVHSLCGCEVLALPVKVSRAWTKTCPGVFAELATATGYVQACYVVDLLIASALDIIPRACEYWLALASDCTTCKDPLDGQEKHIFQPLPSLPMLLLLSPDGTPLQPHTPGVEGELLLAGLNPKVPSGATVSPGYVGENGRRVLGRGCTIPADSRPIACSWGTMAQREAGRFVFCGRLGALAKRGGQFVDIEALAASVAATRGVADAVIVAGPEGLEAFVTLEEDALSRLLSETVAAVARVAGPGVRLNLRNALPRHPVTGKVDRHRLQEQLQLQSEREKRHWEHLRHVQREMLRFYRPWYLVALVQVAVPSLLALLVLDSPILDFVLGLFERLLLLPYAWAALAYTRLLPLGRQGRFYESLSPADVLLLLVGILPTPLLCPAQAALASLLAWKRSRKAPHDVQLAAVLLPLAFLALLLGLLTSPYLQLLFCAGFVALSTRYPSGDRYLLVSLPISFYLVLPKWLNDETQWRIDHGAWLPRRLLCRLLCRPRPPWQDSLSFEDRGRAVAILFGREGAVRVSKANQGLSLTVDFRKEPAAVAIRNTASSPSAGAATPLAGLVRRVCGDSSGLGRLDSLQAVSLAELIRKELGRSITVADVLRCADVEELGEKLQEVRPTQEFQDPTGEPDADGNYRVFVLQFPRHPVDWCLRYTGEGHMDVDAMQRAVNRLVARHSALRMRQTPDEPMREAIDKAAGMWQLWSSCIGSDSVGWARLRGHVSSALFASWPRSIVRSAEDTLLEVRIPQLVEGRVRMPRWDWATHDQYVHGAITDLLRPRRWPADVAILPLFKGEAPEHTTALEAALSKPASEVAWYVYISITHAYSDGLSGQALFADLLRFYEEEVGARHRQVVRPTAEPLALLQRRLRRSLEGRTPETLQAPNDDLYHESICEDWGRREGLSRRIFFEPAVARSLRNAAQGVYGCSVDLAWLTAIMCAMLRLFPQQPRMMLVVKASCRDGEGQGEMVGFLSEARVITIDVGDVQSATVLDVHHRIHTARVGRSWRAPEPFEFGLCIYVNIVSAMA